MKKKAGEQQPSGRVISVLEARERQQPQVQRQQQNVAEFGLAGVALVAAQGRARALKSLRSAPQALPAHHAQQVSVHVDAQTAVEKRLPGADPKPA